jgi:group II intron reverse transcriptase/maturase
VQSALERIRQASQRNRRLKFTSLYHHICSLDSLRDAFYRLKREAAPGVDGQTWSEYGANLEQNLEGLSGRLRMGAYRAKPVRRVFIPKADGSVRPLGVTALEDKLVQSATVAVLNAVYEPLFAGFSYGFRPGRSQHNALDALSVGIARKKVGWVLDADIRSFFDAISHECLVRLIEQRIGDPRVIRLIQKWLKAGVLEDGARLEAERGTPQGGCISPVLANIYLHHAYDCWAQRWRKETAKGDVILVRYADDSVAGFQHYAEAQRFLVELKANLAKFALELHPEKTRILEFGRFAVENRKRRGQRRPDTFDFLGFTHICGKSRAGKFQLQRRTSRKRMTKKLKEIGAELRTRMHLPVPVVGKWLGSVVRGHLQYYGVPLNFRALATFHHQVKRLWRWTLNRRSQKSKVTWERMDRLVSRWLPRPRIVHPYPSERLVV